MTTRPPVPFLIHQIDPGAELIRRDANGDSVWATTTSPPSSIEVDRVYVYEAASHTVRLATAEDMQR